MAIVLMILALIAALVAWGWTIGPFRVVSLEGVVAPPLTHKREEALAALAEHVYGAAPEAIAPKAITKTPIAAADGGGVEGVEQWEISVGAAGRFHLVLVLPPKLSGPAPAILLQNFCGNRAAFPARPRAIAGPLGYCQWDCSQAWLDPVLQLIFGRHINAPPFELVKERGYALAMAYGGDIVPDRAPDARAALGCFAPEHAGALSAWAWGYSRALDALVEDERLDASRIAAWGQSRQGKAALLAGARDERFAAVVGLEAGRGGDALTRHRVGEPVRRMTRTYPHWFTPGFASYAHADPPVDQHELLALIAPRPMLIGHAWRDPWADPAGAKAAVEAASAAWDGAGAPTFFMRKGRHGITREDWEWTLDFLDTRLMPARVRDSLRE